jgi:hypothetical protein
MKKLILFCLCTLTWTAWARPATNLEELQTIDRRGKTYKTSVTPPKDNLHWLADLSPEQFTLKDASSLKGCWSSGPKPGLAYLKLPGSWNDHILKIEVTALLLGGSVRLEGAGQELLSFANPKSVEIPLNQSLNLSLSQNGELRWFLAPNSTMRLQRIRVFQLK